eukprot:11370607-Karenia_brevis.AAC.1
MTVDRERKLQSTQRRMLRSITQVSWKKASSKSSDSSTITEDEKNVGIEESSESTQGQQEDWIEWIQRATHVSEGLAL